MSITRNFIMLAAFPKISSREIQHDVNVFWTANKSNIPKLQSEIERLKAKKRKIPTIYSLWDNAQVNEAPVLLKETIQAEPAPVVNNNEKNSNSLASAPEASSAPKEIPTISGHAQMKKNEEIKTVSTEISRLLVLQKSGYATTEELSELKKKEKSKAVLEKELKRSQAIAKNSKLYRCKAKENVSKLKHNHPEWADEIESALGTKTGAGRPRLEENYPELLKTIVDIVAPQSCADIGRRSELLRACVTLEDLKAALETRVEGLGISRSGLYLRILPRNYATTEGKRHVKTVPVRLVKARNDNKEHAHEDSHFAAATVLLIKSLAEMLGPEAVFVISQDDKARVLLGLPAANKQAPILMHLEYKVTLPDHDWVIAPGHKLIPSVDAVLLFDNKNKLSYSGPTYIAIRSGEHDKSTAKSHATDFRRIMNLPQFRGACLTGAGVPKPVVILFTDGGPDENPRFPKVMKEVAINFKNFDLDAIFVACHAPGQSAYNQVERRMAPLSRDLSGLILPHDYYGSHLDSNGKTIDLDLEKKNFAKAGECLSDVWSSNVIDGHPVCSEYIEPLKDVQPQDSSFLTEQWKFTHVRQSQYCLQIVKCFDNNCCKPWRSNLKIIMPSRFIPAPVKYKFTESGLEPCLTPSEPGSFGDLTRQLVLLPLQPTRWNELQCFPSDSFCPSIQSELKDRICSACLWYVTSKTALAFHKKIVHKSTTESIMETIEFVVNKYSYQGESVNMSIISDMISWNSSEIEIE